MDRFVEVGSAPNVPEIAEHLDVDEVTAMGLLYDLQDYHGVVLHPGTARIWVAHPFSAAPTNFYVKADDRGWWGNCAWCALGVAALLRRDVAIHTSLGAEVDPAIIEIQNGQLASDDLVVHFPVPMAQAWDNVVYTCSVMLIHRSEEAVAKWCENHNITRGDVQPLSKVWAMAQDWYGSHLDPEWRKWTGAEAREIFKRHGLTHPIWEMPDVNKRF